MAFVALMEREHLAMSRSKWADGVVPFIDDPSILGKANSDPGVADDLQASLIKGRNEWSKVTNLVFVPRTNEPDFITFKFASGLSRSNSPIGRIGGDQAVTFTNGWHRSTVVHEIGHAVGLIHEHQRPDRGSKIAISATMKPVDGEIYFDQRLVGPYDFSSIMHYPYPSDDISKISPDTPTSPAKYADPEIPSKGDAEGIKFIYGIVPELGHLAVHHRNENHMEIWTVGPDGLVRGNWFDGGWRVWYQLTGARFPSGAPIGVVSRHEDHMEIWAVDSALSELRGTWWNGVEGWHEWYSLGAPPPGLKPGSFIATRSRHDGHMEFWVVANDGNVWGRFWNGEWQGWFAIPFPNVPLPPDVLPPAGPFKPGAKIASHSRHEDHMELWAIGGAVLNGIWWDGNWRDWYPLNDHTNNFRFDSEGDIAVLGRHEDHMEVWSVDTTGTLRGKFWDGNWQHWFQLDDPLGSFPKGAPLAAVSRHRDHMELWCCNSDNQLRGIWWDGNWRVFYSPQEQPIVEKSPLAAISRNNDHMEVFCIAVHGSSFPGVQSTFWNGNEWSSLHRPA